MDLAKDSATLIAAHNDSRGLTAAFTLNVLHRVNRELEADFDLDSFRHLALWNSGKSRIEMHLESTRDQMVHITAAELDVYFMRGETIHTENSYKFDGDSMRALLRDSGFEITKRWTDGSASYVVTFARPHE